MKVCINSLLNSPNCHWVIMHRVIMHRVIMHRVIMPDLLKYQFKTVFLIKLKYKQSFCIINKCLTD